MVFMVRIVQEINEMTHHKLQQKLFHFFWDPGVYLINQKKVYQNRSMGTSQKRPFFKMAATEYILGYISA